MNLLQASLQRSDIQRISGIDYDAIDPLDYSFAFAGNSYYGMPGVMGQKSERVEANFLGMVQGAYKRNGVIFACERARLSVFSEGRFAFQDMTNGRPGDFFGASSDLRVAGSRGLRLLETPWPNGTTGDLLTRMLQDADLAGNAFWTVRDGVLKRMRPDWVTIIMGSPNDPDILADDLDAELMGYGYWPGGQMAGKEPVFLLPDEVAHFAPTPDPAAHYRGMSWITPVIRELEADSAATLHKLAFFENGATLQTIVSLDKDIKQESFERLQASMNNAHRGAQNAYKTMYVGGGADVHVVGADLKQLDFKTTQGAGETRIAAAAGVPPSVVGLSEGMQGSSLNAGNFGQARRQFAEGTMSTLWRNVAASLATLVPAPAGSQLVVDKRDISFLREDMRDAAEIQQMKAASIRQLIDAGFEPKSVVAAVDADDRSLLVHTGLFSVQLQPPGTGPAPTTTQTPQAAPQGNSGGTRG